MPSNFQPIQLIDPTTNHQQALPTDNDWTRNLWPAEGIFSDKLRESPPVILGPHVVEWECNVCLGTPLTANSHGLSIAIQPSHPGVNVTIVSGARTDHRFLHQLARLRGNCTLFNVYTSEICRRGARVIFPRYFFEKWLLLVQPVIDWVLSNGTRDNSVSEFVTKPGMYQKVEANDAHGRTLFLRNIELISINRQTRTE